MKINETKDYSLFKLHKKNRKVNFKKVEKLAESMKKQNLLPYYPIVVNRQYEILDGQHRYEAAKIAGIPINFVISENGYDIEAVPESNNFQSHWRLEDYVNFYYKDGREPYKKILDLSKKYGIGITSIANLGDSQNTTAEIRKGTFLFENYDFTLKLIQHCKVIGVEYAFPYWNSRAFLRAMRHILNVTGYNHMRMGQKIKANRKLLVKKGEAVHYIKLLEEIYNTNTREPLRFL